MTKTRSTSVLEDLWMARDRLVTEMNQDRKNFFPARTEQIVQLRLINQAIDRWYAGEGAR